MPPAVRAAAGAPRRPVRLIAAGRPAARRSRPARRRLAAVVVLTPGHLQLRVLRARVPGATQMGVELVEGRDLVVEDHVVYMRTTKGLERVDVIYRRIDDPFLDPVLSGPTRCSACRALAAACAPATCRSPTRRQRRGRRQGVYPYVPALIRYYLGEEPILPNVTRTCCGTPTSAKTASTASTRWWSKPVAAAGGYGLVIGPAATDEELEISRKEIEPTPATTSRRRSSSCRATRRGRRPDGGPPRRPAAVRAVGRPRRRCSRADSRGWRCAGARSWSTRPRAAAPRTPGSSKRRAAASARAPRRVPLLDRPLPGARRGHRPRCSTSPTTGSSRARPPTRSQPWADVLGAWASRTSSTRSPGGAPPGPCRSTWCSTPLNRGSILAAMEQARRVNARGVREHLTMEFWEALNSLLPRAVGPRPGRRAGHPSARPVPRFVRSGVQTVRARRRQRRRADDGWRFFMLGVHARARRDGAASLRVRHRPPPARRGARVVRHAAGLGARARTAARTARTRPGLPHRAPAAVADDVPRSVLFSLRDAEDILLATWSRQRRLPGRASARPGARRAGVRGRRRAAGVRRAQRADRSQDGI